MVMQIKLIVVVVASVTVNSISLKQPKEDLELRLRQMAKFQ